MYTSSRWEQFKNVVKYILCRHRHTEIRSIKTYSDGEKPKVLGKFKYCCDCKNNISGWL